MLDHEHIDSRADSRDSLLGRTYTDRDTFISSDHQSIQYVLSTTFLGGMMDGRHVMPRSDRRKTDKRAMRRSPLRTRDEANERALAQQQSYEATQQDRRTTMGGGSPFVHLSSEDDTGSESDDTSGDDPYASQHEEKAEDDGASSDDTVISIRDSVVLRGRLASTMLEAERLSQELQVALANMNFNTQDLIKMTEMEGK